MASAHDVGITPTNNNKISNTMKKLLAIALGVACITALSVNAAEGEKKKKEMTPEQKQKMLEKYDTNKDGKLDDAEKEAMKKDMKGKGKKKAE